MAKRPNICVEFDSVIHSYASGWKGSTVIADPPTAGAIEWLVDIQPYAIVNILSPRYRSEGAKEAMQEWLLGRLAMDTELSEIEARELVYEKIKWNESYPPANMYISARGWRFTGRFPTGNEIMTFKPEDGDPVGMSLRMIIKDARLKALHRWNDETDDEDDIDPPAEYVLEALEEILTEST